jgi:NhaA family Na+:H+ antiporter
MTRALRFAMDRYLLLPAGACIALIWANAAAPSYFTVAHRLSFAVNDVGMSIFFALMTREVMEATSPDGPLHTWRRVMLGVVAAAGGVLGAVASFVGYLHGRDEASLLLRGWPIVCATDLAFTYCVARAVCSPAVLPFLLLVGIASDAVGLAALMIRVPAGDVHASGAALVSVAMAAAIVMRRCDVRNFWPYLVVSGALSWFGLYMTGLHPALALVPVMALLPRTMRVRGFMMDAPAGARDPLSRCYRALKIPSHIVLFLFGIVNAGVVIKGAGTGTTAVLISACVGRPAGILLAAAVAVAAGLRLPRQTGWGDMVVAALSASAGFTFALFFATATFGIGPVLNEVKLGALLSVDASLATIVIARMFARARLAERRAPVPPARPRGHRREYSTLPPTMV